MRQILFVALGVMLSFAVVAADEAPISGTIKALDGSAQTLTVETTAKGKTRQVVIDIKPNTRIVKFARSREPGKTGFVEQTVAFSDLKPGWVVSVTTKHAGDREVAEIVKVVMER